MYSLDLPGPAPSGPELSQIREFSGPGEVNVPLLTSYLPGALKAEAPHPAAPATDGAFQEFPSQGCPAANSPV